MKISLSIFNKIIFIRVISYIIVEFFLIGSYINAFDQDLYLAGQDRIDSYDQAGNLARTLFTYNFYQVFVNYLGTHIPVLFVSIIIGLIIYKSFSPYLSFVPKQLFWILNLYPFFLIWSSIAGKDQLAFLPIFYLIGFSVRLNDPRQKINILNIALVLFAIFLLSCTRPFYLPSYIWILIGSFINIFNYKIKFGEIRIPRFSNLLKFSTLLLFTLLLILFLAFNQGLWSDQLLGYMSQAKIMLFWEEANTTRAVSNWDSISDFFSNSLWGIPSSILGFTFTELFTNTKILMIGILSTIYFYFVFRINYMYFIYSTKIYKNYSSQFFYFYIPSVILGLIILYPYGIFNAGSAIRYQSNLLPILTFYPLLLISYFRSKPDIV